MPQIVVRPGNELATGQSLFHAAASIVADSLSLTSRRVYDCTFRAWCKFADERDIDTDDVSYIHVREFINAAAVAKTTRQNRLSHMRKVLEAPDHRRQRALRTALPSGQILSQSQNYGR